jgi:hypothetical protein
MLSEIVSTNIITLEKSLKNHEAIVKVDSLEKINASSLNSNIDLKVEKLVDENKSIETEPVYNFSMRYILVCIVVVLFLVLSIKNRVM